MRGLPVVFQPFHTARAHGKFHMTTSNPRTIRDLANESGVLELPAEALPIRTPSLNVTTPVNHTRAASRYTAFFRTRCQGNS